MLCEFEPLRRAEIDEIDLGVRFEERYKEVNGVRGRLFLACKRWASFGGVGGIAGERHVGKGV